MRIFPQKGYQGWGILSLTSLWLRFSVSKPVDFQSFSGFASRGIFYEMLKSSNADMASLLHSGGELAPYSMTPILASGERGLRVVYRRLPVCVANLRICLLEHELSKALTKAFLSGYPRIRLIDEEVPLIGISVSTTDFSEFLKDARPIKRFAIRFKTPCFFRGTPIAMFPSTLKSSAQPAKRLYPLPLPVLMFRNLTRLWKAFSNKPIGYSRFLSWIGAGGVAISGFPKGIKTVRVYEHPDTNKWVVGFVGTVHFVLPDDLYSKHHARTVDALLRFAEYSNVGGNRTAGFGVVDYKSVEYEE